MSGGKSCRCSLSKKKVACRNHNHSYFTPGKTGSYSEYSMVICECGNVYRTKAKYVSELPDLYKSKCWQHEDK
jgi:hypothetical protein